MLPNTFVSFKLFSNEITIIRHRQVNWQYFLQRFAFLLYIFWIYLICFYISIIILLYVLMNLFWQFSSSFNFSNTFCKSLLEYTSKKRRNFIPCSLFQANHLMLRRWIFSEKLLKLDHFRKEMTFHKTKFEKNSGLNLISRKIFQVVLI